MDSTPSLDAKTKELWAGVRSTITKRSNLQDYINELRERVAGYDRYTPFVDSGAVSGFTSYETELKNRADTRLVENAQIEDARDIIETNYSSWSDYAGDKSSGTGVFNQTAFDAHRSYLTSNGASNVDADQVNRTLKPLFTPGDVFLYEVVNTQTSFSDLETFLTNEGFASDTASDFRSELDSEFSDWASFETFADNADSIQALLNRFDHPESGTKGFSYDERTDTAFITADTIRMQPRTTQATDDPDPDPSADVSLSNLSISNTLPNTEETIRISCDAENTGSAGTRFATTLVINGAVDDHAQLTIPANSTRTILFRRAFSEIGTYDVGIGDTGPKIVSVGYDVGGP